MNKNTLYKILSFIFISAVLAGMLIYMLHKDGVENILNILKTADYRWTFVCLLLMFAEIILDSLSLFIPLKKSGYSGKFFGVLKSDYICRFFSYITPFNSGGQPVQALYLSKKGIAMSRTLSILLIKYIIYQAALLTWAALLFAFNNRFFFSVFSGYLWLIILGISVSLIAALSMVIIGKRTPVVSRITTSLINRLSSLHIGKRSLIKDPESLKQRSDTAISNYGKQFNETVCSKPVMAKMYLISMLQIFSYLAMTYTIYKALGNSGVSIWGIITVQTFLFLLIAYVPTPGAGLGAEGAFALFFHGIFTSNLNMGNLFWRLFTFYIPFILGSIFAMCNKSSGKKEEVQKE